MRLGRSDCSSDSDLSRGLDRHVAAAVDCNDGRAAIFHSEKTTTGSDFDGISRVIPDASDSASQWACDHGTMQVPVPLVTHTTPVTAAARPLLLTHPLPGQTDDSGCGREVPRLSIAVAQVPGCAN